MTTQQKYYIKSVNERTHLKLIQDKLPNTYDYNLYVTPPEERDIYDGWLYRFEKYKSVLKDRTMIEIKVRDKHYTSLLLEWNKYTDLKKLRNSEDTKKNRETLVDIKSRLVYISVTPEGSYWFDLDSLEKDFEWVEEYHNISTTEPGRGKTLKKVTYIDINKAKKIDVKTGQACDPSKTNQLILDSKRIKTQGIVF
jgi:hypothetical protein